jgi:phosphate transport system permease protein
VWATGAALALTLLLTFALLAVVLWNGLGVFWPRALAEVELADGQKILGEELQTEINPDTGVESVKFKVGNMEDGPAFRWIATKNIRATTYPGDAFVLERVTNMNYYGFPKKVFLPSPDGRGTQRAPGGEGAKETAAALTLTLSQRERGRRDENLSQRERGTDDGDVSALALSRAIASTNDEFAREVAPLQAQQAALADELKNRAKYQILKIAYRQKQLLAAGDRKDSPQAASLASQLAELRTEEDRLKRESDRLGAEIAKREAAVRANVAVFADASGREKNIPLLDIVRSYCPNQMGFGAKLGHYFAKIWELVSADPRESNQDGGLYPAIFGTVLMVFLMAATCFPLGVMAGIYLGEYAKDGFLVRLVRIAVNNLAGIPSIVYGIFGLGFFIYLLGGQLDRWLYPERIDAGEPVFGQGCIIWASLTLGLLTIPVVIVSTEEALRAIPRGMRESSYALGSTKFQTLIRVLVPMASPGMMTGFILAMARAAGEVAPLMITGAVKNAPVPFDGSFPYLHLDRQFMHLGFHILDISCKSPNVEATKPMVYVTTLLLLIIVLSLSSFAIYLRNRMRTRFQSRSM